MRKLLSICFLVLAACGGGNGSDNPLPDGGGSGSGSGSDNPTCVPACGDRECGLDPVCHTPCGSCDSGETCSASGTCEGASPTCIPTTCTSRGAECGIIDDGCGHSLTCGSCSGGETCGAMSPNKCDPGVCTPHTCQSVGAECGTIDNGCGDPLTCGSCVSGEMCGIGGEANVCSSPPAKWKIISNGGFHTCGVKDDGTLWCWGRNNYGQLGLGAMGGTQATPQRVGTSFGWTEIAAGGFHTCGINYNHLYCWGDNQSNQIGDGSTTRVATPKLIDSTKEYEDVHAGWNSTCARSGDRFCWGDNQYGQLSEEIGPVATPTYEGGFYTDAVPGGGHACFMTDGVTSTSLSCAGLNSSGQLGQSSITQQEPRASIYPPREWVRIFAGGAHTCGLANVGTLFCWGSNYYGQLGNQGAAESSPDYVDGLSDWSEIGLGDSHSCGVKENGNLYCWGLNDEGQVGDGSLTDRKEPVLIGSGFKTVSGGYSHTCALDTSAHLFCWGSNDYGQLGAGTGDSMAPRAVN